MEADAPQTSTTPQTRYHIMTCDDEGRWSIVGTQDAHSRDTALRRHFAAPPEVEVKAVAVSESSFRPVIVKSRVTIGLTEVDGPAGEPEAETTTPEADPVAA